MPARRNPSSDSPPHGSTPATGIGQTSRALGGAIAEHRLKIVSVDARHCIARYEAIVICIRRTAPDLYTNDKVRRVAAEALAAHPQGIGYFGIVEQGMPLVGNTERQASSKLLSDFAAHAHFAAVTLEGDGFWSSSIRSVITALSLVARIAFPLRVFRYASDAAAWQARFPVGAPPLALTEAVERCRAKMGPR